MFIQAHLGMPREPFSKNAVKVHVSATRYRYTHWISLDLPIFYEQVFQRPAAGTERSERRCPIPSVSKPSMCFFANGRPSRSRPMSSRDRGRSEHQHPGVMTRRADPSWGSCPPGFKGVAHLVLKVALLAFCIFLLVTSGMDRLQNHQANVAKNLLLLVPLLNCAFFNIPRVFTARGLEIEDLCPAPVDVSLTIIATGWSNTSLGGS